MTGQIKLVGMVLASMPIGDYDRRLTILTKERGRIAAFAKGARKPTSTLLACSQPFCFGEFVLYEGRSSYQLMSAEISNYFAELRNDVSAIYYAMYFCEFAGYMTKENLEAREQLKLLYMTLRAVSRESLQKKLVRRIFELRFLAVNGEMPQVAQCVLCGKKELLQEPEAWFSPALGGICCSSCRNKREAGREPGDGVRLCSSTIYTMQFLLATPLEKLFTFAVSDEVLSELSEAADRFLQRYVGHRMRSEEMLEYC